MSKSLERKQPNQYTVDENGSWISQREIERILGVTHQSVSLYINNNACHLNANIFNQLDAKSLVILTAYYSTNNRVSQEVRNNAAAFLAKLAEAGAEVYIRGMAGRESVEAEQSKALTSKINQLQIELDSKQGELFNKQLELNTVIKQTIKNPRANMIHHKHALLMEWVENGWLEHSVTTIKKHNYRLTSDGKDYLQKIKHNQFELKLN